MKSVPPERKMMQRHSTSSQELIIEREFVDEVCERHAKPGEAVYNPDHNMNLTGDQERMIKY